MAVQNFTYGVSANGKETVTLSGLTTTPVTEHKAGVSGTLSPTSTPPVTTLYSVALALVAGAATLDLTALTDVTGQPLDLTGKKIVSFTVVSPAGNNPVTVAQGAVNPYPLLGATYSFTIGPATNDGPDVAAGFYLAATAADVGASAKDILITGTGTETVNILLAAT